MHNLGIIEIPMNAFAHEELKRRFTFVDSPFGAEALEDIGTAPGHRRYSVEMFYLEVETGSDRSNASKGDYASQQARDAIRRHGGRPATYRELLGYASWWERSPLLGWMRTTVALGSSIQYNGARAVPTLTQNSNFFNLPDLRLCHEEGPWSAQTRFLAVYSASS